MEGVGQRSLSAAHAAALVLGASYLVVGLAGFLVTGFSGWLTNGDETLLIFEVNGFHNLVHVGFGALWLGAAAWLDTPATHGVSLGIAGVLALATVLGVLGYLTILSIDGPTAPDNYLHGASALAAGVAALVGSTSRPASTSGGR